MILELLLPLLAQAAAPESSVAAVGTPETSAQSDASTDVGDAKEPNESENDEIIVEGEAPKPEPVRCRSEKVIGSGIKKKVCRTESQIKAEAESGRNAARAMAADQRTKSAGTWNETR